MRKTTTQWFLKEFKKQIAFEPNSELDIWIKDLEKQAIKRDKRQIKNIFKDGCIHRERYQSMNISIEAEDYFLEKYTNEIPNYFKKFTFKRR
jgi:G:T-mismatch repair DNA endonuclease (very short patch repair protein)